MKCTIVHSTTTDDPTAALRCPGPAQGFGAHPVTVATGRPICYHEPVRGSDASRRNLMSSRPVVGQIHLTVTDLERSVEFYRDVLGLEHLFTVPGQSMAFLDGGGVRLYLGVTQDPAFASRPLVYYRVADLDLAWREVVGRGAPEVTPPHLVHRDGDTELWMAFVRDPDGIAVGLMSERPAGREEGEQTGERCSAGRASRTLPARPAPDLRWRDASRPAGCRCRALRP